MGLDARKPVFEVCEQHRCRPADCLTLQEDLTSFGQWEADWQMKFNVAKCHSMRVTRHQHHKQILFNYSLHNQTLENVQSAKYLGITITDNMDWGQHVSEISSKATKTLGFLRRNLAFAPRSTKEVAYKTLVRPKLEYAFFLSLYTAWRSLSSIIGRCTLYTPGYMQHPFGALTRNFRLIRLRKFRGQHPAGPAGDGKTPVASAKCLMSLNGHLLRPVGTSPPCFSFTRFIVEQCLLKNTSI